MVNLARILSLLCLHAVHGQYPGETCTLNDGTESSCSDIASCPEAFEAIVAGQNPPICSYEGHKSIVCCPRKPPITTTLAPIEIISKSKTKCREYGQFVFVDDDVQTLIGGDYEQEKEKVAQCGAKNDAEGLIIGGEVADPNEFPHMAAIGYGEADNIGWFCGGSLISERFVLTAAHCLAADGRGPAKWVKLGDTDLTREGNVGSPQQFSIVNRIRHIGYKYPSSYNDIALLQLNKDATFNQYVRPACLHTEHSMRQAKGLACGYGKTNWMDNEAAGVLMRVWLDFVPGDKCNSSFRSSYGSGRVKTGIHDDKMVCAGDPKGEKDTCAGDSGGPMQIILEDPECMYSIVGITSFGTAVCSSRITPAIYTRVSNYLPWIESKVWP